MVDLVAFAFEDHLVRVVRRDDTPWFVGVDVCSCLGLAKPHSTLKLLDEDEKGSQTVGGPGGDQNTIIVSEPGVYRLVFRSRKPEAERFKRWLAHEVLPKLRREGRVDLAPAADAPPRADTVPESALFKLNLIREARLLFGPDRARALWRTLGLPAVPPPPLSAADEARVCLRHLLDAPVHEGGPDFRSAIELALDDDEQARALLVSAGIRVDSETQAFVVANSGGRLMEVFAGTEWARRRWPRVLKRLPGVSCAGPRRYGGINLRGSLLPADYLDEEFAARVAA